jgi:hypothetical protein
VTFKYIVWGHPSLEKEREELRVKGEVIH